MSHKRNDKQYIYEHIIQDIYTKHLTQHKWFRNRRLHNTVTDEYKIDSTYSDRQYDCRNCQSHWYV